MKFNQSKAEEISRWILFAVCVLFEGVFLAGSILMFYVKYYFFGVLELVLAVFWCVLMASGFHTMAAITLTEKGVHFRAYIRTKFYPWEDIIQTGILWSNRKGGKINDLVLVPKTGTPRGYQDKHFDSRNLFHLIHLPCSEEVLSFLHIHYGPLDFDFSNGKKEDEN